MSPQLDFQDPWQKQQGAGLDFEDPWASGKTPMPILPPEPSYLGAAWSGLKGGAAFPIELVGKGAKLLGAPGSITEPIESARKYVAPSEEEMANVEAGGIPGKIAYGLGALAPTAATFMLPGGAVAKGLQAVGMVPKVAKALSSIGTFAGIEALGASDQGPEKVLERGAIGGLVGAGLHALGPYGRAARMAGMGGLFGGQTAFEGLRQGLPVGKALEEAIPSTVIGTGMGFFGGRRRIPLPTEKVAPEPLPERLQLPWYPQQIEWWRGPGAKGVRGFPPQEGPLALPPGQGFLRSEPPERGGTILRSKVYGGEVIDIDPRTGEVIYPEGPNVVGPTFNPPERRPYPPRSRMPTDFYGFGEGPIEAGRAYPLPGSEYESPMGWGEGPRYFPPTEQGPRRITPEPPPPPPGIPRGPKPGIPPVEAGKAGARQIKRVDPSEVKLIQPAQAEPEKPPYEMTPDEYRAAGLGNANDVKVMKALREGKAVNAMAVDDYNLKRALPKGYRREGEMFVPPEVKAEPEKPGVEVGKGIPKPEGGMKQDLSKVKWVGFKGETPKPSATGKDIFDPSETTIPEGENYLYHYTPLKNVEGIRQGGLKSGNQTLEGRSPDLDISGNIYALTKADPDIFYNAIARDAGQIPEGWGLLRFKKKGKWDHDPEFKEEVKEAILSKTSIPSSKIEVLTKDGWKSLKDADIKVNESTPEQVPEPKGVPLEEAKAEAKVRQPTEALPPPEAKAGEVVSPVQGGGVKPKPETLGRAFYDNQQRYFTESREITKGKDKGKVEITLTQKNKRGEFIKVTVPAEAIKRMPGDKVDPTFVRDALIEKKVAENPTLEEFKARAKINKFKITDAGGIGRIDPNMRNPLMDLWDAGIETKFSEGGHGREPAYVHLKSSSLSQNLIDAARERGFIVSNALIESANPNLIKYAKSNEIKALSDSKSDQVFINIPSVLNESEVSRRFSDLADGIRKKPQFSAGREAPKAPQPREQTEAHIDELLGEYKNAPNTRVVSREEIPPELIQKLNENQRMGIDGIYDPKTGKIFIIEDMMGSRADVERVMNHEAVSHYATEGYLSLLRGDAGGSKFFNEIWLKYGREGLEKIAKDRRLDLNKWEDRMTAAKEKYAEMTQTGENPGFLKRVYAWIREQIRKLSGGRFGDKITDAEIQRTFADAKEAMISGELRQAEIETAAKIEGLRKQVRRIDAAYTPKEHESRAFFSQGEAGPDQTMEWRSYVPGEAADLSINTGGRVQRIIVSKGEDGKFTSTRLLREGSKWTPVREMTFDTWEQATEGLPSKEAQFSFSPKETGKEFYEKDLIPKIALIKGTFGATVKSFMNLIAPTYGVSRDIRDVLMKMKGDKEKSLTYFVLDKTNERVLRGFERMSQDEKIQFIDRAKTGQDQGSVLLNQVGSFVKQIDETIGKTYLPDDPAGKPNKNWLDNHFRVPWKKIPRGSDALIRELEGEIKDLKGKTASDANTEKIGALEAQIDWIKNGTGEGQEGWKNWFSRRPLEGSKGYFKRHMLEDMSEGIKYGGEPMSYNPMKLLEIHYADVLKYTSTQNMWKALGDMGERIFVKSGEKPPGQGFIQLKDRLAREYFKSPSGFEQRGEWWVKEDSGRLLNNYLSRDLFREHPLGKGLMYWKNITTAMELALSPFHLTFESLEEVGSQVGFGMRKIVNQGKILEGLKDIASAPWSPYLTAKEGGSLFRYIADSKEFVKSLRGEEFMKKYPNAGELIDLLFDAGGKVAQHEDYRILAIKALKENIASKNYIGAGLRSIPSFNEMIMKPLFETYIPRLKLGRFIKEVQNELITREADIRSGKKTRPEIAREVWKTVEDRFGEMNFDNLFWDRTFKTTLQFLIRSVTWKLGNIDMFGKAVTGQSKELISSVKEGRVPKLTPEMAWAWGMMATTATLASVVQYAYTGKFPEEPKDFVYPKIDDQGNRVSLPTYFRDAFHLAHSPARYVWSSTAGWLGRLQDVLTNKDFYGQIIHDPESNVLSQRIDDLIHMTPLPFSVQSFKKSREQELGFSREITGFLGMTKAPYWIEKSAAQQLATELSAAKIPGGGMTREQRAKTDLIKKYAMEYRQAERKGESKEAVMAEVMSDMQGGKLTPVDFHRFRQKAIREPLEQTILRLSLKEALRVWDVAKPEEKVRIAPYIMKKFGTERNVEERREAIPKIEKIAAEMKR